MENSFLGETLLHGHWNQQQKKDGFVGFGNVIKHTPRCSSRSPPLSRQALAADQSGPPKSPAATLAIIFVFHTPYSYCLSTFPSIKQFCPTGHNALTYARSFLIVGNDNFLLLLTQKNLDVITRFPCFMKSP